MSPVVLEIIGYVASILVAVSLMMSSILRLRVINLLGAVTFTVYGFLIEAFPVAAVNLFIVFINLYYLRGMLRPREYFRLLEVGPDSEYMRDFLAFYRDEIERFFPDYAADEDEPTIGIFVLRDMIPAGLLLGNVRGTSLHVALDFVIPQYRDFKIGKYLFDEEIDYFRRRGIVEVLSAPGSREHSSYLRKMGFEPSDGSGTDPTLYKLPLK